MPSPRFQGARLQHDEPFIATAKSLMAKVRDKTHDLTSGKWEDETAARVLVAEINLLREILEEMQQVSNSNFGEEDL